MKLLILDKDGTLVRPKSGAEFVQYPEDQELIPGVAEAIARYRDQGWLIAIASSQGGVAAGHKTLGAAVDEMIFAMQLTGIEAGIAAHSYENEYGEALFFDLSDAGVYWRPITNKHTKFRKPHAGMIEFLFIYFCQYDRESWKGLMVGDRPEDQGAANAAGIDFMWAHDWRGDAATNI